MLLHLSLSRCSSSPARDEDQVEDRNPRTGISSHARANRKKGVVSAEEPTDYERKTRLENERERRCPRGRMAERVGDDEHTVMPRCNQKQQNPQAQQRNATKIGYVERLVVCNLTSNARIVLRSRNVLVQEADAVEADDAQQRDLDDPDAPFVLLPTCGTMHA